MSVGSSQITRRRAAAPACSQRRPAAACAGAPTIARSLALTIACSLALTGAGCSAAGIQHRVGRGENLYRIGKAYGVDYRELARVNGIRAPYRIEAGAKLFVPGATRRLPVTVITPRSTSSARPAPVAAAGGGKGPRPFSWPVSGRVTSRFGKRSRGYHDGIDISARRGASIVAAGDGKVIFSDRLSGYGNVVIIEHASGYTTVYAHNDRNLVRKGARTRRGQKIATVGSTGREPGALLHFEVRKNNVARNPLYYLPRDSTAASGATG